MLIASNDTIIGSEKDIFEVHNSIKGKHNHMKILTIFGTRPESVKTAPLIKLLEQDNFFKSIVCITAQHRQMLDQVLKIFNIKPDYDLNIMKPGQDIFDLTSIILIKLKEVLQKEKPDIVLVQGDTTTAFVGALAAFYSNIAVGHIEAGLRTYNKYSPFPEEINRKFAAVIADYHFAPTKEAKENLLKENIPEKNILITGNTGIDSLLQTAEKQKNAQMQTYWENYFKNECKIDISNRKIILVTGHRRESFGKDFENICFALKQIAQNNPQISIVYPVHLNPNVQKPVFDILEREQKNSNIFLIKPLDYEPFVFLMSKAHIILTDSGGIQEEAPSLGKPVLVMRNTTERPEGIKAGSSILVGTKTENIVKQTEKLFFNSDMYNNMARINNPYGDGKASQRILDFLKLKK